MVQKTEKPACKTTPKGRKRVSKKAVQKKDQSDDVTSTTFYVVEKIKESKLIDQTIHYNIKWEDWPEIANTDEPETRLMCDKKLLEFALSRVTSKLYVTRIRDELNALESEFQSDYLETLDPLAICAQTTIFAGSVKFVNWDTIGSKIMLLKYLRDYQQSYVLNSMYFPEFEDIDKGFDEYSKQLRYRMEQFPEYPMVQIKLPVEKQPTFYAPPPLTNLLFEPVTEQIYDSRSNHFFPPKSTKLGFNQVQPFIAPKYFEYASVEDHPRYQESRAKAMGGDTRWNFDHLYRFDLSFVLRQEVGRGWTLRVAHSVKANTPLMMMTGVIRPCETAHESLKTEGERVAFSSFIEIPGTGKCLDRREFHDFSKYIPHSCSPNCSVRFVKSGGQYYDLVVYSLEELNPEIDITLDYFKGFKADIRKYFSRRRTPDGKIFNLYEDAVDFVHCMCNSPKCRNVLYVDQSLNRTEKMTSKIQKLGNLDPKFQFKGCQLVDSPEKVWEIEFSKFKD